MDLVWVLEKFVNAREALRHTKGFFEERMRQAALILVVVDPREVPSDLADGITELRKLATKLIKRDPALVITGNEFRKFEDEIDSLIDEIEGRTRRAEKGGPR